MSRRQGALLVAFALAVVACTGDDGGVATTLAPGGPVATFEAGGGLEQVWVVDAPPGATAVLSAGGEEVARAEVDQWGAVLFREVAAGDAYTVKVAGAISGPIPVRSLEGSTPERSFYEQQELAPGYGYLETRDGTLLAVNVVLPGPPEDGPYPTVVEYSGYDPARPADPIGGELPFDPAPMCQFLPALCTPPSQPASVLANLLGFAVVGVNMRGTGCSGGAFAFFERLQLLDGYDAIEAVAAQPWVEGQRVAMVGLSYPGIAQLFVAAERPPSLAAITPLSVIGDLGAVLRPGGITNQGFALSWAEEISRGTLPYGQGWERDRVEDGDEVCEANQRLHGQRVDLVAQATADPARAAELAEALSPERFAADLDVPVFIAGAFQDEQTGGDFSSMLERFTATPLLRATLFNGTHADALAPQVLVEWKAFLDLVLRGEFRPLPLLVDRLAPLLVEEIFGASAPIPESRWAQLATGDPIGAVEAYLAEPPVRLILENGAGAAPGAPVGTTELALDAWPPAAAEVARLPLDPSGTTASFRVDRSRAAETIFEGARSEMFRALPDLRWEHPAPGTAVTFDLPPLAGDALVAGPAGVELWIRADGSDVDLEVVLREVRPDGVEYFLQAGVLRASHRRLADGSTPVRPRPLLHPSAAEELIPGEWTRVQVPLPPLAHVVRAGSVLRVTVGSPGGNRPLWGFEALAGGADQVEVATGPAGGNRSSTVSLMVLAGAGGWPPAPPPCPSLRGQPCRTAAGGGTDAGR